MPELRKIEVQYRHPKNITPWPNNAKVHTTEQLDKIAGSIAAFGFHSPIVIDKQGVIIAGHGRREAALRLALEEVPVIVADHLSEHEVMAARIADNRVAQGETDLEKLRFDMGTLYRNDFDLKLTGLDPFEIEEMTVRFDDDMPEDHGGSEDDIDVGDVSDKAAPEDKLTITIRFENEDDLEKLFIELRDRNFMVKR